MYTSFKATAYYFISGLFIFMFTACSSTFFENYKVDEQDGMENIQKKINDIIGNSHSITFLKLTTKSNSSRLKCMEINAIDTVKMQKISVIYSLSDGITQSDTTNRRNIPAYFSSFEISDILPYIKEAKKLIPEGYSYSHVTDMVMDARKEPAFTVGLKISDKSKIKKNKFVRIKKHTKEVKNYYKGRLRGTRNVTTYFYTIKFKVTQKGVIII